MNRFIRKIPFHLLLVAIVGLVVYSNTFDVPFQFDDFNNISDNPLIRNLDSFISSARAYDYNPRRYIGYLTFALNYRFGGLDVTGYHIVNLGIHILNAFLIYLFVVLTFRTPYFTSNLQDHNSPSPDSRFTIHDSRFIALFAALLFVAHPIQTQAVTYIVQRFTSLTALFYLLSVVLFVKGRLAMQQPSTFGNQRPSFDDNPSRSTRSLMEKKTEDTLHPVAETGEGTVSAVRSSRFRLRVSQSAVSSAWYLCSLVSAVLAMKTKEIAFTLPVVILLYEFFFFGSGLKKKVLILIPVLLTLVIIPVSIMGVNRPLGDILSDLSERTRVQTGISRWDYLATQMRVITTYIRLIFVPVKQNLDYRYPIYHSFFTPGVFLSALFLLSLFGVAVSLLYRSRSGREQGAPLRLIAFGIFWFFIALSVESSIIPIADVIFEHRLYLPSAGAFVALAAGMYVAAGKLGKLLPGRKVLIPFALIIIVLSATAYARNSVWKDGETLWEDVLKKAPDNPRAHNNLGFIYYRRNMLDQAGAQFAAALRLMPSYSDARINLGVVYNAKGMVDPAIEQFMIVLSLNPDDADAHNNLGIAYVSKGMIDQGITHYQIALRLKPDYPEAYNNLGVAFSSEGRFNEAIGYFRQAISLQPDFFEARHNLALAYEKMGR